MRLGLVFALLALIAAAYAVDIIVDDPFDVASDNGFCSLREAINVANGGTEADCDDPGTDDPVVISLAVDVEAAGLPTIVADVEIIGGQTITGLGGNDGIFSIAATVGFTDVIVQNGNSIRNNTGGCFTVYGGGWLHLEDSTVRNCRADVGHNETCAGAVWVDHEGGISARNTLFSYNSGHVSGNFTDWEGPMWRSELGLEILNGNGDPTDRARFCAGAVFMSANSSELIEDSLFEGNTGDAGGAIYSHNSIEMQRVSFVNNTAFPGHGGAVFTFGDVVLEGSGDTLVNNHAFRNGGGVWAGRDVLITGYSDIVMNFAEGSGGAVFAVGGVRVHDSGDIIENRANSGEGGAFKSTEGEVWLKNVKDLIGNAAHAKIGGLAYGEEGVRIENVDGDIRLNRATSGAVAYADDGHVTISDVAGQLVDNIGNYFGGVVYGENGIELVNIRSIKRNIADYSGGAFMTDSSIYVANVPGGIVDNIGYPDETDGGVFYAEQGIIVENVGVIDGNIGNSIFYANQGLVVRDVGEVVNNKAHGDSHPAFGGYEGVLLQNCGRIWKNSARSNSVFYGGEGDLVVKDVHGEIAENIADMAFNDGESVFYGGNAVTIRDVDGGIRANVAGFAIAYASNHLSVENIGGSIVDNVCVTGPVFYGTAGTIEVRNINGSFSGNIAGEGDTYGALVYSEGSHGFVENIMGDVRDNVVGESYLFYAYDDLTIRQIFGDVAENLAARGIFAADGYLDVQDIHGFVSDNTCVDGKGLFYAGEQLSVHDIHGEVSRNTVLLGSLFYADDLLLVRNIDGGIEDNSLSMDSDDAAVFCCGGGVEVDNIRGSIRGNLGYYGLVYADSEHAIIRNIHGDIANNQAVSSIMYGYESLVIENIDGHITGLSGGWGDFPGLFYSEGNLVVRNINGAITNLHCRWSDSDICSLFYTDDGIILVDNIDGGITHNIAAGGLFYNEASYGGIVISNINGGIVDNHGSYDGLPLFYCYDGYLHVDTIHGDIAYNSHPSFSALFYADQDVVVQNIYGEIAHNTMGLFAGDKFGVIYSSSRTIVRDVQGGIHSNEGGYIVYGEDYVSVTEIGGEIADNVGVLGVIGAYVDGIVVANINGGLVRNRVLGNGGVLYCEDCVSGIDVHDINGEISNNSVLETGAIFYNDVSGVRISNIHGDIAYNNAPYGIFYGDEDGVTLENVYGDLHHNVIVEEGGLVYANEGSTSSVAFISNVGAIEWNLADDEASIVYGSSSVIIQNVRGPIQHNSVTAAGTDSYGVFYACDGSVIIRNIEGPIQHNSAPSYGGVAYAYQGVVFDEIGGDITDNHSEGYALAYAEEGNVLIQNVHGGIINNFSAEQGLVAAETANIFIQEIHGDIADNYSGAYDSDFALFYGENAISVLNIYGGIRGNVGGGEGGIFYSDGSLVVSNIHGDITENHSTAGAGCSFGYADESASVNKIHGSIFENWSQGSTCGFLGSNNHAELTDVNGDIYRNGCQGIGLGSCNGGVVYSNDGCALRRINGTISRNQAGSGGVLYANGAFATISDIAGDILNNFAQHQGGVIYSEGSAQISRVDGRIMYNHVDGHGGGVLYGDESAHLEDINGEVAYNSAGTQNGADSNGSAGGVAGSNGEVVIANINGAIHHNYADRGGVAYSGDNSNIRDINGAIYENVAFWSGGVVAAGEGVILQRVNGPIFGNVALESHGGVAAGDNGVLIKEIDGSIYDNEAGMDFGDGGVAYSGATVLISDVNGDILNSRARDGGVAFGDYDALIHNVHGDIANNVCARRGGVVYAATTGIIHEVDGWVTDNHALSRDGGVIYAGNDALIHDILGSITDNSGDVDSRGGVLYAEELASVRDVAGDVTGNHAGTGGVLYAGEEAEVANVGGDLCHNYAQHSGGVIYSQDAASIESIGRHICNNVAHTENGGVVCTNGGNIEISESGVGICSNQAHRFGGVAYAHNGNIAIHAKSTKVTHNEARTGRGGVAYINHNSGVYYGSIDVGTGYVTGNEDSVSTDPFSFFTNNVTQVLIDFEGASLPPSVAVNIDFDGSDGIANEPLFPAPVVNVTSFQEGIPLDFVLVVERDGLPAHFYRHNLDVEALPDGLYRFPNIVLPSGSYRLRFQIVTGCGNGAIIAETAWSGIINVGACQDPRPIHCPTEIIVADSDAFTCGAYVVVDDIQASSDCDTAEFSNDYNSVTVDAGDFSEGSASDVYPVGSTDVLLTVSTSGLDFSCPVQVIVEDVRPFTSMTCPLPIEAVAEAGLCSAEVTVPLPTALDNCPVLFANNQNAIDDASGRYHGGVTEVEFTGYNNGPSATCTTTVTVHDHEAPVITCPASFNTTCENRDVFFQVDAVDNCVAVDVYPLFHEVSPLGGVLEGGVSTLVYEAADAAGNTAQCSFTTSVFSTYYRDADGDGYGDRDQPGVWACNAPEGWVLDNTDCNDFNADAFKLYLIDFDGDGFGDPAFPICAGINATIPESFLSKRGQSPSPTGPQLVPADEDNNGSFDCDDTNPFVHPSSPELCDGIDNNCNGEIDEADNCPPAPVMNPVPVPTPVDNPVPVFVDNPIPVPVPVPNPIPVPVPYVVTVPNDDINAVFSISISSASSLQSGVIALFIALALSFFA